MDYSAGKPEEKMKKIIILPIIVMLVFSFCSKEKPAGEKAVEKTTADLFNMTMGDMQKISIAFATLNKNWGVIPQVASIKEFAIELGKEEYNKAKDTKPLVELITGFKSAKELESYEDKESEELLLAILAKKLNEQDLAACKDKETSALLLKLLLKDAWGNDFYLKTDDKTWWIGSAGSDGQFAGFEQTGEYRHLDEKGDDDSGGKDIIFSGERGFIYGPEVR